MTAKLHRVVWMLLLLGAGLVLSAPTSLNAGPVGFGVLGDSYADEYQFHPQPRPAAQNFVEQLAQKRGLNFGPVVTQPPRGSRNQGFAQNWALSGARTQDMERQVEGLQEQVAAGQVDRAMVFVGTNNFRDVLYRGAQGQEQSELAITNTVAAVTRLLLADPDMRVAVANVPDVTLFPEARNRLAADPALAPRVAEVSTLIDTYNSALAAQFEQNTRVAIVDANRLFDDLAGGTPVEKTVLEPTTPSTDPSHLFVDDIHAGTVAHSLLANEFLKAFNLRFGDGLLPLTPDEVLEPLPDPSPTPDPGPAPQPGPSPGLGPEPTPIPLPAGAWAALAAGPLALLAARRMKRSQA